MPRPPNRPPLAALTIIAGGQTGADRAGLDWAIRNGIPHGGWCPEGRVAEDGPIPRRYALRETPLPTYAQRTAANVRDADGTVIFSLTAELSGGSFFTADCALSQGKPWLHVHRSAGVPEAAQSLRAFLRNHQVRVLNVAGPRASQAPGIEGFVTEVLDRAFRRRKRPPRRLPPRRALPTTRR